MGRQGGLATLVTLVLASLALASEDGAGNVTEPTQLGGWPVAAGGHVSFHFTLSVQCLPLSEAIIYPPGPLSTSRGPALPLSPGQVRGVDRGAAVSTLGPHGLLLRGGN